MATRAAEVRCGGHATPGASLTDAPGTGCYYAGVQPFSGVASGGYWSQEVNEYSLDEAWHTDLSDGQDRLHSRIEEHYVCPVRGAVYKDRPDLPMLFLTILDARYRV
jgi:hypothetical protein